MSGLFTRPSRAAESFGVRAISRRRSALVMGAALSVFLGACSSDSTSPSGTPHTYQFRVSQITMPTHNTDFAIDLDGDAAVDNDFGSIVEAFSTTFDMQTDVNASIQSGQTTLLLNVVTRDTSLTTDGSVQTTLYRGTAASFNSAATIDGSVTPSVFSGSVSAHQYTSVNPVTTSSPVAVSLKLPIFGTLVSIPLVGAHIQFTTTSSNGTHGLVSGALQGAIKASDFTNVVIPGIAASMNATIQANPSSQTSLSIKSLFDTGCSGGGGTANDGIIQNCELSTNSLIGVLLAPDIKIYNSSNVYAPSTGTPKDAVSFAIGFTASATTF